MKGENSIGEKVGIFDLDHLRIRERLKKSYIMVIAIATVAAVLGIISIFTICTPTIEIAVSPTLNFGFTNILVFLLLYLLNNPFS